MPVPREFANLDWLETYIDHRPTSSNVRIKTVKSAQVIDTGENESETTQRSNDSDDENDEKENDCAMGGLEIEDELKCDTEQDNEESTLCEDSECASISSCTKIDSLSSEPKQKECRKAKSRTVKRNKPWSAVKKPSTNQEIDKAIMETASSLSAHLKKVGEMEKQKLPEDVGDEDNLFCRSLAPRLRRLPAKSKAFVRLQIEQVFCQAEFAGSFLPDTPSPASQLQFPGNYCYNKAQQQEAYMQRIVQPNYGQDQCNLSYQHNLQDFIPNTPFGSADE